MANSHRKLLDKAMTLVIHKRDLGQKLNLASQEIEGKIKYREQLQNEITEHERAKRNMFPELEDTGKALENLLCKVADKDLPQFVSELALAGEDTMEDVALDYRASCIINEFYINA